MLNFKGIVIKYKRIYILCILFFSVLNLFSKEDAIYKHPAPVVNFEISDFCFGDTTFFTNTTVLANTYIWTISEQSATDSSVIFTSTDFNIKFLFPHKGAFKVELDGDNGHFITLIRTLYVDTTVNAHFDYETCSSHFINLSSCFTSCFWDFGDGHTSTQTSPLHFYDTIGLYTVKLIASNGTKSSTFVNNTQVYTTNNLSGSFITQINKDSVLFIASDTANQAPSTQYHWAFGDGATANLSHLTRGFRVYHTYLKKDTTYLTFLLVKTTCLNAFTQANLFVPDSTPVRVTVIYPNPTTGDILHLLSERKSELNKIEIRNSIGNVMTNYAMEEKTRGYDLNLVTFPNGIYFMRLYFGNDIVTKKIVKAN